MGMDIYALLVTLQEYDIKGELHDEAKDTFEAANVYRRQHPFKVSAQDEADFPGLVFKAGEQIVELVGK